MEGSLHHLLVLKEADSGLTDSPNSLLWEIGRSQFEVSTRGDNHI